MESGVTALASKKVAQEIYKISRKSFLENGLGATPSEIRRNAPDYKHEKIMKTIGEMEMVGSLSHTVGNEQNGRKVFFYKPNEMSEWAMLFEEILGLNPKELNFNPETYK